MGVSLGFVHVKRLSRTKGFQSVLVFGMNLHGPTSFDLSPGVQKQRCQWPNKKDMSLPIFFLKKELLSISKGFVSEKLTKYNLDQPSSYVRVPLLSLN